MPTAYVVAGVRTPIGRYGGALAPVRPDDLAAHVLRGLVDQLPSVEWEGLDEVVMGCANQSGEDNRNIARMAGPLAELPTEAPGSTVNRLCGSGLDAVAIAARADPGGRGGPRPRGRRGEHEPRSVRDAQVRSSVVAQRGNLRHHDRLAAGEPAHGGAARHRLHAESAETVAREYAVSRADQDAFALRSQARAAMAAAGGRLDAEIFEARRAVATMCVGVGQGISVLFEAP